MIKSLNLYKYISIYTYINMRNISEIHKFNIFKQQGCFSEDLTLCKLAHTLKFKFLGIQKKPFSYIRNVIFAIVLDNYLVCVRS